MTMLDMIVSSTSSSSNIHEIVDDNSNYYRSMVMDAMRMNHDYLCEGSRVDEELNIDIARVFTIKSDYRLSRADYDNIIEWAKNILP